MPAVSTSPRKSLGEQFAAPTTSVLLWSLQSAHRHLEACICELERVTSTGECDPPAFGHARFRVSQASFARRMILGKACAHLSLVADDAHCAVVDAVRLHDRERAARSTEHLRAWPPTRVAEDWSGYCKASRAIRMMMREAIREEQQSLLPLLRLYGDREAASAG